MDFGNIAFWVILGGLAGWLANLLTGNRGGCLRNVVIGIIGSFVGGLIFKYFGGPQISGFNLDSIVVAVVGSVAFLVLINIVSPRK